MDARKFLKCRGFKICCEKGVTMDVAGKESHPLEQTWCFWFTRKVPSFFQVLLPSGSVSRPSQGARTDQSWFAKPIATVATVEEFWKTYSHLLRPNDLVSPSDFHLFQEGISPLWEDAANEKGGKWMVRLRKARVFFFLFFASPTSHLYPPLTWVWTGAGL